VKPRLARNKQGLWTIWSLSLIERRAIMDGANIYVEHFEDRSGIRLSVQGVERAEPSQPTKRAR
jgi:hypothetical protein